MTTLEQTSFRIARRFRGPERSGNGGYTAGRLAALPAAAPEAVGFEDATAARRSYRGLVRHPFPGCFTCGTEREPGDGLRLAPGLVGDGRTACVWLPDPSLASGPDPGMGGTEFVWA